MAFGALEELLEEHKDHEWEGIPPCVYCKPCKVRLYQGSIPASKDPILAAKRAACKHLNHATDDYGEIGQGFYWICADCGYRGWYE